MVFQPADNSVSANRIFSADNESTEIVFLILSGWDVEPNADVIALADALTFARRDSDNPDAVAYSDLNPPP